MKVQILLELLQGCDPAANMSLCTQPHYPMEHNIAGIATRQDCRLRSRHLHYRDGAEPGDILIVDGNWLRYGELFAWDVARSKRG
jgi:hypothetical protein